MGIMIFNYQKVDLAVLITITYQLTTIMYLYNWWVYTANISHNETFKVIT